ncbi:tetratricopeptide repeat protein [Flavobacterium rakeshii]|uniref:Tetratricopeptide repeat protein n=1 Tax=Flavobacterium rakeshii TaxID=1038845 RepID=A0A6N8HIG6_9FLAO|nr:tetratricopeptide repeat protein [Flavobacterium rakeshii]MUV05547.1 tetratricopeptide repeat protein [Flavobacterium rakeshii]
MKGLVTYSLLLCSLVAFSQEKEKDKKDEYLSKGNKEFSKKEYVEAEADYRISQSKNPTNPQSMYNLGNAIYRQGKPSEAMYAYFDAIEKAETKKDKHRAYHNLGNMFMEQKDYQTAVEAYRNALRNDPYDEETRYNFALAKEMLKNNPPQNQNQNEDKNDENKDQNKDQNDKNQDKNQSGNNKDDKNKKPEDKGNDPKKDKGDDQKDKGGKEDKDKQDDKGQNKPGDGQQGDQDQKPQQASPSKQRMENLLDAMNNEEKKVQDKINAEKVKGVPRNREEKDW